MTRETARWSPDRDTVILCRRPGQPWKQIMRECYRLAGPPVTTRQCQERSRVLLRRRARLYLKMKQEALHGFTSSLSEGGARLHD